MIVDEKRDGLSYDPPGPNVEHRPWLFVRHDPGDRGQRPVADLSFHDVRVQVVLENFVLRNEVVVQVSNASAVPAEFCVVEFYTAPYGSKHEHMGAVKLGAPRQVRVPGSGSIEVRSERVPYQSLLDCVLVRVFDPIADPDYSNLSKVEQKRHLAHFTSIRDEAAKARRASKRLARSVRARRKPKK